MKPIRSTVLFLSTIAVVFAQDEASKGEAPTENSNTVTAVPTDEQVPVGNGGIAATPSGADTVLSSGENVATNTAIPSQDASSTNGGVGTPSVSIQVVHVQDGSQCNTLTGIASLFGVLFAIALGVIIWLFVKRRQDRKKGYLNPVYASPENGTFADKSQNAQIDYLQAQLSDANKRLTAVQGTLLASGQKPHTKDDNTLSREYTQINTDIVGWTGNYFKASTDQINLTSELYEFLTEHIPKYQTLLGNPKTKQLVVRAIVSQVLQESFEKGAFFGTAVAAVTPLVRTSSASASAINAWRSDTFFILEKSDDFTSQRAAAVSTITDRIEQLTYPLAATNQTFQGDEARYMFIEAVVKKASDFAVALGKQRANFQVLSEPAGCEFGHAAMDDVSQQTDIVTNNQDGTTSHPLEGKPIQATIFPLLLKYGDESGDGYDQITMLSKAKVLV